MKSILVLFVFMVFTSCGKDPEIRQSPTCIEMVTNPDFVIIPFKKDYTIQLPNDYTGPGIVMNEGVQFSVNTSLGSRLFYWYGCATDCHLYFGAKLASPAPDVIKGFQNTQEELIKAAVFCNSGEIQAILYHSITPGTLTHGKLYMKRGQDFEEGLLINFDIANIAEIESILRTISN